jgi:hypothetical protein
MFLRKTPIFSQKIVIITSTPRICRNVSGGNGESLNGHQKRVVSEARHLLKTSRLSQKFALEKNAWYTRQVQWHIFYLIRIDDFLAQYVHQKGGNIPNGHKITKGCTFPCCTTLADTDRINTICVGRFRATWNSFVAYINRQFPHLYLRQAVGDWEATGTAHQVEPEARSRRARLLSDRVCCVRPCHNAKDHARKSGLMVRGPILKAWGPFLTSPLAPRGELDLWGEICPLRGMFSPLYAPRG